VAAPAIRAPRSSIEARNQKWGSFGTGWCAHLGRIMTEPAGISGQHRRRFCPAGGGDGVCVRAKAAARFAGRAAQQGAVAAGRRGTRGLGPCPFMGPRAAKGGGHGPLPSRASLGPRWALAGRARVGGGLGWAFGLGPGRIDFVFPEFISGAKTIPTKT
jgi:hypothetical protein